MTYNFDMEHLLDKFDGDAEKLANAFATALNTELAERHKLNSIDDAAADTAEAWNRLVDEYFNANDMPDGYDVKYFYIDEATAIELMKFIIKALPYINLFVSYCGKVGDVLKDAATTTVNNDVDDFETTMKRFFDKNNI